MELKEQIKTHLTEKKEKARLEKIEANSKLAKVILYTDKNNKYCDTIKTHLNNEGIQYEEKEKTKHTKEITQVFARINLNVSPVALINGTYLAHGRDFQNPQQLVLAIQYLGHKDYVQVPDNDKVYEQIKTMQYHLFQKLNQLEQKLNPIINFISNIQKEIEEEDKKGE